MNREAVFNEFAKYAESDTDYYTFGKHGIIEDVLSWFELPSKKFLGASSAVHADNLAILHDYIISRASDDQVQMIDKLTRGHKLPDRSHAADSSGKVFVSMPMNPEKSTYVEVIREGIKNALLITGDKAYFMDRDAHNENIYVKMMHEITACKFLIADLTSQNTGVYYEAGYAKALGKTVVLTCKNDDVQNIHFDLKQAQIVIWKNAEDLSRKLADHIKRSKIGSGTQWQNPR